MPKETAHRSLAVKPQTAAAMLDISRSHVYQLVERGTLRMVSIPGSRAARVLTEDVYRAIGLTAEETDKAGA